MRMSDASESMKPALSIAVLLFVAAGFRDAWAYLDPGTGSYVLQLILAAALGAVLTVKIWWARFISLFKKNSHAHDSNRHANG